MRHFKAVCSRLVSLAFVVIFACGATARSLAAPTLGFVERWTGTTAHGWQGGGATLTIDNPGAGGVQGPSDGFLRVSTALVTNFGVRSMGVEYLGDWQLAGITQVRVWLNDIGTDEPFEIHYVFGVPFSNVWQYNTGFIPPLGQWAQFVVDLNDSTMFTHTNATDGKGYLFALKDVQVVHLRHDLAPYVQNPDPISGGLGIDDFLLTNGTVGIPEERVAAAGPVWLAPPRPNPSGGPVALQFRTADARVVRLEIVDVMGRVLLRRELRPTAAGPQLWLWDGRDDAGRNLPAGVYRARAYGAGGGTSQPLVRLH